MTPSRVGLGRTSTLEFLRYDARWAVVYAIIVLVSPFVGFLFSGLWGALVGLLLGVLSFPVGFLAVTKVREITHHNDGF